MHAQLCKCHGNAASSGLGSPAAKPESIFQLQGTRRPQPISSELVFSCGQSEYGLLGPQCHNWDYSAYRSDSFGAMGQMYFYGDASF